MSKTYLMMSLPIIPQWLVVLLSRKLQKVKLVLLKTLPIIVMFLVKFIALTIILILFNNKLHKFKNLYKCI